MNVDLSGRHALVCGSSQGIGRAIAIELASLGASVTLVSRSEQGMNEVLGKLKSSDTQKHSILVSDMGKPAEIKEKIPAYLSNNPPVNILVNNTSGPPAGQAIDATTEEYLDAFNKHIISGQIITQALIEGMKKSGYGRIINIISTSVKQPIKDLGVSNTIRAAMANWAKTLSFELGQFGITVNNILPGATNTNRMIEILERISKKTGIPFEKVKHDATLEIPLGRFAEPEDIAMAVAFLASPSASYISGINLPVDGGRLKTL
ncbi:MAG: SDR family oxidoreductase [Bacteroidetes bacterium]|nr:SDR family oxidoreductase [Bacteroidota bacterium]